MHSRCNIQVLLTVKRKVTVVLSLATRVIIMNMNFNYQENQVTTVTVVYMCTMSSEQKT